MIDSGASDGQDTRFVLVSDTQKPYNTRTMLINE